MVRVPSTSKRSKVVVVDSVWYEIIVYSLNTPPPLKKEPLSVY